MVSGIQLFRSLFNNLALLIILVTVYGVLNEKLQGANRILRQALLGIVFGAFIFGFMQVRINVSEGVFVDQRNAIVILSGAFGGPLSALIAAMAAASYRAVIGGRGVLGGILGIGLSAIAGTVIRALRPKIDRFWKAALCAVCATVFILPGFLPIGDLRAGWELMKAMALPYGSAISIGLLVGGLVLETWERRYSVQTGLMESERKYRRLFESLIDVGYRTDRDGVFEILSPSVEQVLGYSPDEMKGRRAVDFYRDPASRDELIAQIEKHGFVRNFETEFVAKDGSAVIVALNTRLIPLPDGGFGGTEGIFRDITRRKLDERRIASSLAEKEALLKELYHRTNNNMQLIASFLRLKGAAQPSGEVDALVESASARIFAISLAYEKLYDSGKLSRVNIREYIEDLIPALVAGVESAKDKAKFELDIDGDVEFLLDTAIPLGLAVDEMVMNSFEHAFPGDRRGTIRIRIKRQDPDSVVVTVSDDGIGMPPGFDASTASSFGLTTLFSLIRLQLRGSVEIRNEDGVEYRITLKDNLYRERI